MEFINIFVFILQFIVVSMLVILSAAFLYSFIAAVVVEIHIFTDKLQARLKRTKKFSEEHHENN